MASPHRLCCSAASTPGVPLQSVMTNWNQIAAALQQTTVADL